MAYKPEEGDRVVAQNPRRQDQEYPGIVVDVLSVMYYIQFDNGDEEFVYQARPIRQE
jgi:hypothetical protein